MEHEMEKKPDDSPYALIVKKYQEIVRAEYPAYAASWPVASGANIRIGTCDGWMVFFLEHSGNLNMHSQTGIGDIPISATGVSEIRLENIEEVRERLERHFRAKPDDAVFLAPPSGIVLESEFHSMLKRHELVAGIAPMKIFLSHKSPDKGLVRDFKRTLELLGFDPWLDEDAMTAGTQLERGILQGMHESCAAVFFLTPKFSDESFLAAEINYAIAEHRKRPEKFSIITLLLPEENQRPPIPALLAPFVWKEPATHLEGIREVLRALPLKVGAVRWR